MKDFVLKLVRKAVENYVKNREKISIPSDFPEELKEKRGVFVTLYKKGSLRGCIGLPYPQKPLIEGVIEAAALACEDPRFESVKEEELKDILIEISILTKPKLIETDPRNYAKKIVIGEHGLILRKGVFGSLFLPKVPVEQNWTIEQYLENLCYKAGLTGDMWLDPLSRIYKFEAEVISEGI